MRSDYRTKRSRTLKSFSSLREEDERRLSSFPCPASPASSIRRRPVVFNPTGTSDTQVICHPGLTRQRQDRDPVHRGIRLRKPCEPNEYWIPAIAGMTRLMGFKTRRLNAVAVIELWRIDPVSGGSGLGAASRALKNLRQPKQKSRVLRPGFPERIATTLTPRDGRCPSCFQRCRFHRPSPWSGRCHRGR